jgi:hypothetical protein
MAIASIADTPGGTTEQAQALQQRMNLPANPPSGALLSLAGPFEGGWRVINVWESQEAWEAFRRGQLEPALQQLGFPTPQFQIWPLQGLVIAHQQH